MAYKWREGARPPKNVSADVVAEAISDLGDEVQAEALLEASKKPKHVLHEDLWSEGDQVWANRARLQRCREIISSVVEEIEIGGKTYETRAYEFVRGGYRTIQTIASDQDLIADFIQDVADQMGQFQAKLSRINQFRRG